MAGNRPKSLDELNSIFDKTLAAEKAIKKGTSLLEKGEDIFASFTPDAVKDMQITEKKEKQSEEISGNVSEFIAKFTAQTETEAEAEQVIAKPQMTVLTSEKIKKENEVNSVEAPAEPSYEPEKISRDELMDEYVRIMSDEEDDVPSKKKISRKEKKKRKKEKSEKNEDAFLVEEAVTENPEAEQAEVAAAQEESAPAQEEPVQAFEDVVSDSERDTVESDEEAEPVKSTDFEIQEEEISFDGETEEGNDFEFPENYTPEWMKDEGAEKKEEKPKKEKAKKENTKKEKTGNESKKAHAVLKVFLSIVFVALICISSFATVFKTFVAVNTGKVVADNYYVFTTNKDYPELNLLEGDLIITEKRYASDGEIFVYVDYNTRTFEFGKRADSITKEDGEVLYVIEKDGERTLVSRDDCKGVLFSRFENRGKIVGFLADNYIIIISVAAVVCLIIILLFSLVLREKKVKKEKTAEDSLEVSDEDFENIFSEI